MWTKGSPCAVLVGMWTYAATMENTMEVPQNFKIELLYGLTIPLLDIYPKQMKFRSGRDISILCSLQHYSKSSRYRNNLSSCQWMNKYRFIYNNILPSYEKEGNPAICDNPGGSWGHHTEWNKSGRVKQILTYLSCKWAPQVVQWVKSHLPSRRHNRCGFDPWVKKIPWSSKWLPTSVLLLGKSHGQKSLVGYSPWGSKS